MGRSPCCSKEGLNRGAWTAHEDKILKDYIRLHGEGRWRGLPKRAGLKRCGKSCRLRWLNYLRPNIKRGNISSDEEELIIRLHKLLGNRWSLIAGRLPGRTDNEIKNYWNTNLGKKVKDQNNQSTSTLSHRRNVPTQPNEKSTGNIPKLAPSTESHVVRTKATKCSKVVLITPPQNKPNIAEAQEGRPNNGPMTNDQSTEPSLYDNDIGFLSSSFLGEEEEKEERSPDSLIDYYNVEDAYLSDILNSDFSNVCDFSYGDEDEMLSPCSEQPLVFSDEILKDWTLTDMSNNLHSFTSLLESGEG